MGFRISLERAIQILKEHGQPNILSDYTGLRQGQRVSVLHQIADVDWKMISAIKEGNVNKSLGHLEPPEVMRLQEIEKRHKEFYNRGQFMVRAGKVGAVMIAGGAGTKLGFGRPKGEYNIGVSRDLYIYECLINNLLDVVKLERGVIPLYIMVDRQFERPTRQFFEEHNFFGYPSDMVLFFPQNNNYCVDLAGNLFLVAPGHLAASSGGDGGWFKAMVQAGLLRDLERRGIEWLNVFSVDNVLQRIADPMFIGATMAGNHDSGAKVVRKLDAFENINVFCTEDNRPSVVHHYDLDDIKKTEKDESGDLRYGFGVIYNYLFRVDKLKDIMHDDFPVQISKRKIPYMDSEGRRVTPQEPNGYKFETHIEDMVSLMDSCLCYEVLREKEFALVKQIRGDDSVKNARKYLEENGVKV